MRVLLLQLLLRVALLVAIVASAALFVDYQQAAGPGFCGVVSGCAEVRASPFASLLGVPLPTLGLGAFLGLFALTVWASTKRHLRWLALFCGLSALGAVALIAIMVLDVGALCEWCMATDVGAIVAAVAAMALLRCEPVPEPAALRWAWSGLAVAAIATTLFWGRDLSYQSPPPAVQALQVPGKVTVVVFTDFQCPFCRLLHGVIREQLREHPDALAVRLVMVPLPSHPGADIAALGYLCVDEDQRADMAHALYELPFDELIYEAVGRAAKQAGVDEAAYAPRLQEEPEALATVERQLRALVRDRVGQLAAERKLSRQDFDRCAQAAETKEQLAAQIESFQSTGLQGLPAAYVGNFVVEGADETMFRASVGAAIVGGRGLDARWMFVLQGGLLLIAIGASLWWARRRRSALPTEVGSTDPSKPR